MAVYHPLGEDELAGLCQGVGLTLKGSRAVPKGSINTNYALDCQEGKYFLRLTHVRRQAELDYEAGLLAHLKEAGFPCPRPLLTRAGGLPYQAHPHGLVTVFPFLPGEELNRASDVTPDHAFRAGEVMGKLHRLGASFGGQRENPYSPQVVNGWLEGLEGPPGGQKDPEVRAALPTLRQAFTRATRMEPLPMGPIHADYFRDNVKWLGDHISAVFDFEMACTGPFMLDAGIGLCEWAFEEQWVPVRMRRFVEGYLSARRVHPEGLLGLYEMTLFGAVRYSCSRIRDFHLSPLPEGQLARKDWRRYLRRTEGLLAMDEWGFQQACGIRP